MVQQSPVPTSGTVLMAIPDDGAFGLAPLVVLVSGEVAYFAIPDGVF